MVEIEQLKLRREMDFNDDEFIRKNMIRALTRVGNIAEYDDNYNAITEEKM